MDNIILVFMMGLMGAGLGLTMRMALRGPYMTWVVCGVLVMLHMVAGIYLSHKGVSTVPASAVAAFLSVSAVLLYRHLWQSKLTQLIVDAPALMAFAQGRFGELDIDGDGLLTKLDLWEAKDRLTLSAAEQYLLKQLDANLWLIGHVIHTTRTMSPMTGTVVYLDTFGASRDDIGNWSLRALDTYERDFSN